MSVVPRFKPLAGYVAGVSWLVYLVVDEQPKWKGGHGGYRIRKYNPPKTPKPLKEGTWFRVGDEDDFTWMKVVENLGFKVLMETRFGHQLTVDRKLVLSPPAKRPAPGSGV